MYFYMFEKTDLSPRYRLFDVWNYDRTILFFDEMDNKDFTEIFDEDTIIRHCLYHYRYYWKRNGKTGMYDVFKDDTGRWHYVIKVDDTGDWIMSSTSGSTMELIRAINDIIDGLCK